MPFFEHLKWNSIFECFDDVHVSYQMKAYMSASMSGSKAHVKTKHTNIQKCTFTKIYIFSGNGSNITFEKIVCFSSSSLPFTKLVFIFSISEQQR